MSDSTKINLLLVSVGSLVGQNLLEIISHQKDKFNIIGSNSIDNFNYRQKIDHFVRSPKSASEEFPEFLEKVIVETAPDWVIPCRDEECLILAKLAQKNSFVKERTSLTDPFLAQSFLDKYLSFQICQEIGLPFAKSCLKDDISNLVDEVGFPLVVKPRNGFASIGVKIIFNQRQLEFLKLTEEKLIFQEFLGENMSSAWDSQQFAEEGFPLHFSFEEDKYSIQLYATCSEESSSYFIGKHRMKNGISHDVFRFEDAELESIARFCLTKLIPIGLRGPLNIQLQKDKLGKYKIFEFNSRFTGATTARYYLGFNELDILLKEKMNISVFPKSESFQFAKKVIQTIGIN